MATKTLNFPNIIPRPEFSGILRDTENYSTPQRDDRANRINHWFDRLVLESGIAASPPVVMLMCLCSALLVAGLAYVVRENFFAIGIGAVIGLAIPLLLLQFLRRRRQNTLLNQFPPAIDELARAAKTGRSLANCLELVAHDTPAPLGSELRWCVQKIRLGSSVSQAIRELPHRTGLSTANVLATALTVHEQSGGNLVQVLERLSRTVRDRIQFRGRLRAATAASRATAVLMLALPPMIILFFLWRDPDYLNQLWSSGLGRRLTILALVLELIGSYFVLQILKNSEQT